MKLLSGNTFLYKRILPVVIFGFLGFIIFDAGFKGTKDGPSDYMFIIFPVLMMGFVYFQMKKFTFNLIDKVYDEGETLLFINDGKEVRVYLKDIKNISYSADTKSPRVTISVRYGTELGDELSFLPPASFIPFKRNKDIMELIDRIDRARG